MQIDNSVRLLYIQRLNSHTHTSGTYKTSLLAFRER